MTIEQLLGLMVVFLCGMLVGLVVMFCNYDGHLRVFGRGGVR
jgi:hypothetical protein